MNWEWLLKPVEPRWLFGLMVGLGMFACLTFRPDWGIIVAVLFGIFVGLVGGVIVKLVQERGK